MLIPFLDLTRQHQELEPELHTALVRVLRSGQFILGPEVAAFEAEWARYCAVPAAAGVASGTDALALALVASGAVRRGAGDEVITNPLTAGYTALAILNAGGVPVFADIDPQTYTLDPAAVEQSITPRTRAILPVHLYGQLADMDALCAVAAYHDLFVIEDVAQAHGARRGDRRAGSFGTAAAFSFYPTKNLGACGDAGAIVAREAQLIGRVKNLRQGGHDAALDEKLEGRNSRLDELQAALLRVKLNHLAEWNEQRKALARFYHDALGHVPDLQLPTARDAEAHVYHLFVIQHPERERLRTHLAARHIETLIHYPALLHQQRLFRRLGQPALPVAETVAPRLLSLPLYPQLRMDEAQAVADAVRAFV
ncbi:MAG: DegT/DnrJ/EryC1/StrS family aminotransferase [Pyrinomonadaceae bacterium]